ncbi:MAG: glycosyltransferase family 2 protein [Phormidesmis sp.]
MFIQIPLLLMAIAIAIPCTILLIECISAIVASVSGLTPAARHPCRNFPIAVLMPAHNETAVICETLAALTPQLSPQDTLLVVADNCTDDTATLARQSGATVLERDDKAHRGKGYALDFGLRFMAASPPAIVVIVDADCQFRQGTVRQLADRAMAQQRPVQAVYLISKSLQPSLKEAVSAFAFKVKNLVRPLGLRQLNLPCSLTGTGMAFPWSVITGVDLASGSIVEDMKLGSDVAIAGAPPLLCPDVTVVGPLPPSDDAAKTQRTRWEHGHLQLIARYCPQLVVQAVVQGRVDLIAIALDLLIPPLSLLVMLWLLITLLMTAASAFTSLWLPAFICYGVGVALMVAILSAWARFAQSDLPLQSLLSVPLYILWKIPLYLKFLSKPQVEWVRTRREMQQNK